MPSASASLGVLSSSSGVFGSAAVAQPQPSTLASGFGSVGASPLYPYSSIGGVNIPQQRQQEETRRNQAIQAATRLATGHASGFSFGSAAVASTISTSGPFGTSSGPLHQTREHPTSETNASSGRVQQYEASTQSSFGSSSGNSGRISKDNDPSAAMSMERRISDDDSSEDDESRHATNENDKNKLTQPFVMAGKVRRLQEKRFYGTQKPNLDGNNMFWKNYALHLMKRQQEGESSAPIFLSAFFPEALQSVTEGFFAFSVLNLAFKAAPATVCQLPNSNLVQLKTAANAILYHQDIVEAAPHDTPNVDIVVKQWIVPFADLHKPVPQTEKHQDCIDLFVNRLYCCKVQITNNTAEKRPNLKLLVQIPQGAIPLRGTNFYTKSVVIAIDAHTTKTFKYQFFFPSPGHFEQYPAHLADGDDIVAWVPSESQQHLHVIEFASWDDVTARGTIDDVISHMKGSSKRVRKLPLERMGWRCRETKFYDGIVGFLQEKMMYSETVWKFALLHGDMQRLSEFLSGSNKFQHEVGLGLELSFVVINDLYRDERFDRSFSFDHTEFGAFQSQRAHSVSGKRMGSAFSQLDNVEADSAAPSTQILNKQAREYYGALCSSLSYLPHLSKEHLLVLSYFMILFNRISDAIVVFMRLQQLTENQLNPSGESTIVYDYIDSYLDFFRPERCSGYC